MHSFRSKPQVHIRADRKPSAVHATIAPSRPQQATAKKAPSVNARVQYVQPPPKREELFTYVYEKPENVDRTSNLEHVNTEVPFTDLRTIEDQSGEFTLGRNGFQLEKLHVPSDIDWDDDDDVSSRCATLDVLPCLPKQVLPFTLTFSCSSITTLSLPFYSNQTADERGAFRSRPDTTLKYKNY